MPASGRHIPTAKLSRGTPGPRDSATGGFAYGAITLYGGAFQPTSATARRRYPGPRPTSPHGCPVGIWFGLSPFRSPLLRGSLLASLPAGTKMFPFPAFPPLTGRRGLFGPGGKPHSGIPGSKPACGSPGLIAACHALPRRPSRAIHRAALPCDWEGPAPPSGEPSGVTPPPHQPRLLREPSCPRGVTPRATAASSRGGLPA